MPNSPQLGSDGVVRVSLYSEGKLLPESVQLRSLTVQLAVNRVPSAWLEILDGDMPNQDFPVSDTNDFKPGAAIKIAAGYGADEATIFEGIVIKHAIKISGSNHACLHVECRDKSVKMTVGRTNANHIDKLDSDIIESLIQAHGLSADVTASSVQHKELVQYHCSDWDFMLARAQACGMWVQASAGKLTVGPPVTTGAAVLKVSYGKDLIDFQAEIDARHQYQSAQAVSWDMKTQAAISGAEAAPATLNEQGDLDSKALASVIGLSSYRMQNPAPTTKEMLGQWAKAQQLKSGLSRIRGQMSFQGSATAVPGCLIELEGVGNRFSGQVLITGVTHSIGDGNWVTEAQFGQAPEWFTEQADIAAPAAAGLLPAIHGLHTGVVMKLADDPETEHRVQVSIPVMAATTDGVWARLLQFHGSNGFGAFFLPEVGDEVVLGYFNDDPSHPVILGSLYSSKQVPPYTLADENNTKAIVTRCKSKIEFDEEKKVITITTPGKNKVVLDDEKGAISLLDQNNNSVVMNSSGITLDSPKDIKLSAKGGITLDAVGAVKISSKADVKTTGLNISSEAQVGFKAIGTASAELQASGQTVVKGAMVMIN